MSNEDVYRCHVALSIPTDPEFGSLNLAAAMQVIAYDWRTALGGFGRRHRRPSRRSRPMHGAWPACWGTGSARWWTIGFLDPAAPKKLMPRLNQLFNRAAAHA